MTQRKRLYQSTVGGDINYDYHNITANTTQTGDVTLTGDTTQTGDVTLTGNTTQTGNVILVGNHTLTGTPTITGSTTQTGNIGLTGNITQTGNINLTGTAAVTGNITATTTIAATGTVTGSNLLSSSATSTLSCAGGTITTPATPFLATFNYELVGNTVYLTIPSIILSHGGTGPVVGGALSVSAIHPTTASHCPIHVDQAGTNVLGVLIIATDGTLSMGLTGGTAVALTLGATAAVIYKQTVCYSLD